MLARLSSRLAGFAQRWVPDPFVIALGLTLLALGLGLAVMPQPSVSALAAGWFARTTAPTTLAFTTQMALILVAGATLARAPLVSGLLGRLADWPASTRSAVVLTSVVAMSAALLNWGFGLVAGAVLAREIGDRARAAGRPINYPLVGAAGYTGLMVWHGGFSGSAPLKVTEGTPGGGPPIPIDATILSPLNLALSLALLLFVPWLLTRMCSPDHEAVPPERTGADTGGVTAEERHPLLGGLLMLAVVALGGWALLGQLEDAASWWRGINLDTVIVALLMAGLLLFGTPLRFAKAFGAAVPEAGGILLQFPFYFGILGLLEAGGLVDRLSQQSAHTALALANLGLPLGWCFDMVTFFSAGLVNLFVPSGGGQWAVQGTIMSGAAAELGLPLPRAVMALAYGDEWTNMLQPFWALALLGITGLKARDILGYTLTVMLGSGLVYALIFAVF